MQLKTGLCHEKVTVCNFWAAFIKGAFPKKRAVYREKPERSPSCLGVVDIILPIKNDCLPCEQEETTFKKWEKDRRGLRQPFSPVQNEQRKSMGLSPTLRLRLLLLESVFYHQDQLVWKRHGMGLCKGHGFYKTL